MGCKRTRLKRLKLSIYLDPEIFANLEAYLLQGKTKSLFA